ncbi:MAG: hypothetical protein EOO20_15430 [Chryseobacterium sp.]|nr:MAG: hypothetical protein EOO20_15430 [Chryseobacterium sp.]
MKKAFSLFMFLILMSGIKSAKAQKAYDFITYRTTIYGDQTTLQLADGYLLASKITIRSKIGNQEFEPSSAEADDQGDLRFDAVKGTGRYKENKGSWLTVKNLNGAEYPSMLKAIYWDGKMQKTFIFKRQ